jgi:hypothetical protein
MCGIAGIIDLRGQREPDRGALEKMTQSIFHRGPDEDGFLAAPGVSIGQRRLSIVGLADGQQPIYNEDRTVAVMYNGELFDYPEQKASLESRGHKFRTHSDTELLVHLYEDFGEGMFEHLHGQFAFAIVDLKKRTILLGPRPRRHLPVALVAAGGLVSTSARKSKRFSPRAWFRLPATIAGSTTSSRSSRWGRGARCSPACRRYLAGPLSEDSTSRRRATGRDRRTPLLGSRLPGHGRRVRSGELRGLDRRIRRHLSPRRRNSTAGPTYRSSGI